MKQALSMHARLLLGTACAGLVAALTTTQAIGQNWPAKPIQIIIPFEPGGATDLSGRMIGERLVQHLGHPGIAINKAGAGSIIGSDFVAKSAADGYTILLNTSSLVKTALVRKATGQSMPYDVQKDLDPIAIFYKQAELLMLHPSVKANTVKDLVALAKAKPGAIRYASTGFGSVTHFTTEYFSNTTGISLSHIPYKGGGSAIPALIRGDIEMMFLGIQTAASNVKSGKVRAIAITSKERTPAFPDVQTLVEQGVGDTDLQTWYALFAPARTPRLVMDRLFAAISKIVADPDFSDRLRAAGGTTIVVPGDQVRKIIDDDLKIFSKVIAATNMKLE